jgi:DNA-binding IclR family transcriptional regulator
MTATIASVAPRPPRILRIVLLTGPGPHRPRGAPYFFTGIYSKRAVKWVHRTGPVLLDAARSDAWGLGLESGVLADESRSLAGAGRNESIRRAFRVLDCLAMMPGASVAAVARETGLPRATVTRVLGTLADVGAVRRDGDGWTLGPTIAALAAGVDPPLAERAGPHLEALAADLGETVMLAVPEGAVGARVVAEAAGPRMVGVGSWLGRTLTDPASGFVRMRLAALDRPARERAVAELKLVPHSGSTIRSRTALLAELDRIGQADHAEVVDEFEQGLAGLAVPIRRGDRIVGLLAVYLPTIRLDAAMRKRALEALRATAQSLTGASETTTSSSSSQTR